MIKCIYCGKEAEYIANGCSVCKEHLENISSWNIPNVKEFNDYKKSIGL